MKCFKEESVSSDPGHRYIELDVEKNESKRCVSCGCHDFEYDGYFEEYTCKDCGRILGGKPYKIISVEDRKKPVEDSSNIDWENVYIIGGYIVGGLSFCCCWIYAVISWDWFLGVGLGWIPSFFIAIIARFIWPLLALVFIIGMGIVAFSI